FPYTTLFRSAVLSAMGASSEESRYCFNQIVGPTGSSVDPRRAPTGPRQRSAAPEGAWCGEHALSDAATLRSSQGGAYLSGGGLPPGVGERERPVGADGRRAVRTGLPDDRARAVDLHVLVLEARAGRQVHAARPARVARGVQGDAGGGLPAA